MKTTPATDDRTFDDIISNLVDERLSQIEIDKDSLEDAIKEALEDRNKDIFIELTGNCFAGYTDCKYEGAVMLLDTGIFEDDAEAGDWVDCIITEYKPADDERLRALLERDEDINEEARFEYWAAVGLTFAELEKGTAAEWEDFPSDSVEAEGLTVDEAAKKGLEIVLEQIEEDEDESEEEQKEFEKIRENSEEIDRVGYAFGSHSYSLRKTKTGQYYIFDDIADCTDGGWKERVEVTEIYEKAANEILGANSSDEKRDAFLAILNS